MRALLVASLLVAVTAFGQEAQKADYSPEALRHVLTASDETPPPNPSSVHFGVGSIEFRAFNMNWRIMYLPFAMPFSGSVRYSNPQSMWPDPFALTNTQLAETPRTWRDTREVSKERKRIEQSMRDQAKVKVNP